MNLKQSINVAIFGLSLRKLNDLKAQIQKIIPDNISINWTNVSEPNLHALLINDLFFDTPSIQNLIRTNHPTVLRLIGNLDRNSVIENNILYLPIINNHPLQNWFDKYVLNFHQDTLIEEKPQTKIVQDNSDKQRFLEELLNPLNGKILIFDNRSQLGLADARAQWFWASPQREQQQTDYTLNFTYATMSDSVKMAKIQHQGLKFWLWNLLWQSPDFIELAPDHGYFQLKYWPQPNEGLDRKDILRMSACFAQGAQINAVAEHLNLPLLRVRQFIAASLGSTLAYPILSSKANFVSQVQPQKEEVSHSIRKFFGSLRRRLGL